jgi:hypothetical protein
MSSETEQLHFTKSPPIIIDESDCMYSEDDFLASQDTGLRVSKDFLGKDNYLHGGPARKAKPAKPTQITFSYMTTAFRVYTQFESIKHLFEPSFKFPYATLFPYLDGAYLNKLVNGEIPIASLEQKECKY